LHAKQAFQQIVGTNYGANSELTRRLLNNQMQSRLLKSTTIVYLLDASQCRLTQTERARPFEWIRSFYLNFMYSQIFHSLSNIAEFHSKSAKRRPVRVKRADLLG